MKRQRRGGGTREESAWEKGKRILNGGKRCPLEEEWGKTRCLSPRDGREGGGVDDRRRAPSTGLAAVVREEGGKRGEEPKR